MDNGTPTGYNRELNSKNNKTVTSVCVHAGATPSVIVHIKKELPNGVSDNGEWVMVSINYCVYHAPWWLGGWTYTYGENDMIYTLYDGNTAQNVYNQIQYDSTITGIFSSVEAALFVILGTTLDSAIPSAGTSLVIGGIVAAVILAGIGISASIINYDYGKLYESTYANELSGQKYIETYLDINCYYPDNPIVSLDSSIGLYGVYSDGNTLTIFPNIAFGLSTVITGFSGLTGIMLVHDYSEWPHSIANKIGTNHWSFSYE